MRFPRPTNNVTIKREPVLGTVLQARFSVHNARHARAAESALLAEVARLERIFSVFDPNSELCRWRRGDLEPGDDLTELLSLAAPWQRLGDGSFNPAVGVLTRRWQQAEREGHEPSSEELAELAASIREPTYRVTAGCVDRLGDCSHLSFNAIAKGFIVDRAAAAAIAGGNVTAVVLNIGGALVHRGAGCTVVGVENPQRAYDNERPLAVVEVANQGMATSGSSRRGFVVNDRWYSHVLDPRTGHPVDRVASASVIGPDTVTADVAATVLSVLPPTEGLVAIASNPAGAALACCVVDRAGHMYTNDAWDARIRLR